MKQVSLLLYLAALVLTPFAASGHGVIVYGARYYLQPGSRGRSYSHIYRIDPDGQFRRQLTFGNSDDFSPYWSSDGSAIEFSRYAYSSEVSCTMKMRPDGTGLRRVRPDKWYEVRQNDNNPFDFGAGEVSPDGKFRCTADYEKGCDDVFDAASKKLIAKIPCVTDVLWLSNGRLAAIQPVEHWHEETNKLFIDYKYTTYNAYGIQLRSIYLRDLTKKDRRYFDELQWTTDFGSINAFQPDPALPGTYFFEIRGHQTTYYWLDPGRGTIRRIISSESRANSPDQRNWCGCEFVGTQPYELRKDGTWRTVWECYLVIVNSQTGVVKTIQNGLVDCSSADWKQGIQ